MTQRNRKTLTDNFADGKMPTQEAFGDLIDSMVNIIEDGFEKTPKDGVKIAQQGNEDKLITFYNKIPVRDPLWSIAFSMPASGGDAEGGRNLNFFYGANNATGLTLASVTVNDAGEEKPNEAIIRVGINNNNPEYAIDAEGVVASNGRIGREGWKDKTEVLADGKWHTIIAKLEGCQAFEIMAGVGKKNTGRYALLHAYALNTFNSKKSSITSHQSSYLTKCDQIDLQWVGTASDYSLQMRTRCSYMKKAAGKNDAKEEIFIRYYVTQLWFDSFMEGSVKGQPKIKKETRPDAVHEAADIPAAVAKHKRGKVSFIDKIADMLKSIGR